MPSRPNQPAREKVTSSQSRFPARFPPRRQSDHFSARLEPKPAFFDTKSTAGARFDKKVESFREQNPLVAASSQSGTCVLAALPRSNQIDATLFDEGQLRQ
jgi:hypothetical protein